MRELARWAWPIASVIGFSAACAARVWANQTFETPETVFQAWTWFGAAMVLGCGAAIRACKAWSHK